MYTVTICFLGAAAVIVAVSACLTLTRMRKANTARELCNPPACCRDATWCEIKEAWANWLARCQEIEASKRKAIRSFARTLVLSAALGLVGVVLEVDFGQPISVDSIVAGLVQSQPVRTVSHSPGHSHRHQPG